MVLPDRAMSASMTLEDWSALPEDDLVHYELQEGMLIVTPRPLRRHQLLMMLLGAALQSQLPAGFEVVPDFEVVVRQIEPATVRVPDLVVLPVDGPQNRVSATDVVIAVEIMSPGSRGVDRHLKRAEYAEAGIPYYWLVDLDGLRPSVTVFELEPGRPAYGEGVTWVGTLDLSAPFDLCIDIERLTRR